MASFLCTKVNDNGFFLWHDETIPIDLKSTKKENTL